MIWYACYGSNMDSGRFLIYIQGGNLVVNGTNRPYDACQKDSSPPRDSEPYIIRRRFYFAEKSKTTWNGHGVGFISNKPNSRSVTYAKLYLISKHQFNHLFEQENAGNPRNINYKDLEKNRKLDFPTGFYNRIIQLKDSYKNYPILTFTNKRNLQKNNPMDEYVQLISNGIKATHNLSDKDILRYIKKAKK